MLTTIFTNRILPTLYFVWLVFLCPVQITLASDGIATDGTMGPAQTLSGANVTIPQSLGTTAGNNLFHSFGEFNIANGQTVNFTGSDTLQNVVSRVTGTDVSNIDGTLKSSIAHADFYFLNPNGIVFGAGALVDVPGAFHVSTADKIDFLNHGGVFYADLNQSSTLTSEAPAAFGFLNTSAVNNGLIDVNGSNLAVKPGQKLDIVAGNITVENTGENTARITAPSGEIRLVAMQGTGSVSLEQNPDGTLPLPTATPSATNAGHITVNDIESHNNSKATLDTTGNGGGRIALWGGETSFTKSSAWADNTGEQNATSAKGVDIRTHSLNLENSTVSFDAFNKGHSGNVTVETTDALRIVNGGFVKTSTYGSGNAGNVKVSADTLTIDRQSVPAGVTGVFSETSKHSGISSYGNAGTVDVKARAIDIFNGGVIESNTIAPGDAGQVTVTADTLTINNQNSPVLGGIFSINAAVDKGIDTGNSGNITVNAGKLAILNGGVISSSTYGQGNGANVTVRANTLTIDNPNNATEKETGIYSEAKPNSNGHAGNVTVTAGNMEILNAGKVSTTTFAQGHAGNIVVNADKLIIDGQANPAAATGIFSQATQNSSGQTGDITIQANNTLKLSNGAKISIENAGNAADPSAVKPGTITVTARDINMKDSSITTNSTGNIGAGNIAISFSHWLTMDPSFIQTTANTGNGGTISIGGGELIYLQNSGFKTSVSGANSNGGNIVVDADILLMDSGIIQANAVGGSGGNITLSLKSLIPSSNSLIFGGVPVTWQPFIAGFNVIQAASQAGISGTLNVTAPQLNLSGILANLGGPQFDTTILSQDYCGLGIGSSLTRTGTGGLMPKSGEQIQF